MRSKVQLLSRAALIAALLTFLVFGTVLAWTITVDGDPSDWPTSPSASIGTDVDETDIPDDNDIKEAFATNSTSTAFFRVDTYANTNYAAGEFIWICLDIDANAGTGYTGLAPCSDLGVERYIEVKGSFADIYTCTATGCSRTGSGTRAHSGNVTEVSASLADLGINSNRTVKTKFYFDNMDYPPDDGTDIFDWDIPDGTAVTLTSITARSEPRSSVAFPFVAASLISLGAVGLLVVVRRHQA